MKFNVIAIDLAKNVFQVCKTDRNGKVIYNKAMSRHQLKQLLCNEPVSLVAMEACGGTHYWARYAKQQGHQVKSMSARRVQAFRQGQKTDANDAQAIAIAAMQPQVKACRLLTTDNQCEQGIVRIRDLLVGQKVAAAKQIRDLLLELGLPIAKGDAALMKTVPDILEDADNGITGDFRAALNEQLAYLRELLSRLAIMEKRLTSQVSSDRVCQRLQQLEGIGPVNSMGLKIALHDVGHFRNGREASACIGVTPVQHSSGGKARIGSISKISGHKGLRSSLYQGAMAVIRHLEKRQARTIKEQWLKQVMARRGKKVAAIALANKNVRTAYAILKNNSDYQPVMLAA